MFPAADSADCGESRLWKHSRSQERWECVLHSSVVLLKLKNEKENFGYSCCLLSCSYLPAGDRKEI